MTYLLALSIGPVQDFIAAARRTSDLAAGSRLMVELVGAAATEAARHGRLIFPADPSKAAANKILVELDAGVIPHEASDAIKTAARNHLSTLWKESKKIVRPLYRLDEDLADAQIDCFLEIYAAWVPFDGVDYQRKRREVDSLLAARKALRNFDPAPCHDPAPGIHAKSPLDPAYECILRQMPEIPVGENGEPGYLRLRKTEFLDAVSVLKRTMGRAMEHVPSTRYFARLQLDKDADLLTDWLDDDDSDEKYAYIAVLAADGDKMGEKLSVLTEPALHRDFSAKLSDFEQSVRSIIDDAEGHRYKQGHTIYSGGDDVLALLPVRRAVACATRLADAFKSATGGTLSAGIAVVHYRQPLSISLEQARGAERAAKDSGRDSLCLAIHTRGGQPLPVTRKWDDWDCFDRCVSAFEAGEVPRGVAYELRKLAREFKRVGTAVVGQASAPVGNPVSPQLLWKETERIWGRKKNESGKEVTPLKKLIGMGAEEDRSLARAVAELTDFADLLVAARFLTNEGGH
ncbi:MAG: type III-B CRISPR-associated protein Cas10/Cmr2 [Capsulimonadaceae bacterium]